MTDITSSFPAACHLHISDFKIFRLFMKENSLLSDEIVNNNKTLMLLQDTDVPSPSRVYVYLFSEIPS